MAPGDTTVGTTPAKVALEERLAAVIRGGPPKDNRERLQLAYRAYEKTLYAASARLFSESLEADPKLADDQEAQHRYNAACAAALASVGKITPTLPSPIKGEGKTQRSSPLVGAEAALAATAKNTPTLPSPIKGEEKTKTSPIKGEENPNKSSPLVAEDTGGGADSRPTDAERAKLRNQARIWLESELATWTKLLDPANGPQRQAIEQTLRHWQQDTDLATVRDDSALAKIPVAEREAWKELWGKVDGLLAKAQGR